MKKGVILKIKSSQVFICAIHGIGSSALGLFLYNVTGLLFLGYLASAIFLGLGIWLLIKIQDVQDNRLGYLDVLVFFLNLLWISLGVHWIVALVLFFAFVIVGARMTSKTEVE